MDVASNRSASGYAVTPRQGSSQSRPPGAGEFSNGAVPLVPRGSVMELEHSIGNAGFPSSLFVIPNTTRYATSVGGCLVLGDVNDSHSQQFLRGHDDTIVKIAPSEDGRLVATGQQGSNGDVCIWSLETNSLLRRLRDHDGAILALAMSPDGSITASIGGDLRLVFVDTSNGGQITHMPLNSVIPITDQFAGLYIGPRVQDNKRRNTPLFHVAVVTTSLVLLFQLDPYAGQLHQVVRVNMSTYQRRYSAARFTCNGDFLLVGSEAGDVALLDTQRGGVAGTARVCSGGVRDILMTGSYIQNDAIAGDDPGFRYAKFGPGSERRTTFYIAGGDSSISQIDIADHVNPQLHIASKKVMVTGGMSAAAPVAANSIGMLRPPTATAAAVILGGASNGCIYLVDMAHTSGSIAAPGRFGNNGAVGSVPSHQGVTCISDSVAHSFSVVVPHPSDPELFFTASEDGFLRSWDLSTYRQRQIFEMDVKTSSNLVCSGIVVADGLELILSSWNDGAVRCHDVTNAKLLWTQTKAHRTAVTAITLSPSLKFFVTGSSEGEIKVVDIRSREVKLVLKDHSQAVVHLQLFDDDRHLLSASKDRTLCTWDLSTGRRVTAHEAHSGPITSAFLGRNQSEVYSVAHDHRLSVHDLRYRESVRSVAYCPPTCDAYATKVRRSVDERLIVTGGTDQLVKLWEPRTLSVVTQGYAHSSTIHDVGLTCDNRQVLSAGSDAAVMVWNVYA